MSEASTPSGVSDSEDNGPEVTAQDRERIRTLTREWIELPAKIAELEGPVKQLKARHKEAEKEILEFMRTFGVESCGIPDSIDGGGLLVPKVSVTKATVKKENWNEGFNAMCRKRGWDGVSYDDLEKEVKQTCPQVTKMSLKRIKKN